VIAGSPLGTTIQIRANVKAVGGLVLAFIINPEVSGQIGAMWQAGSTDSDPITITVARSVRPGAHSLDILLDPGFDDATNMNQNEINFVLNGLIVEDGYGPLLNVTRVVPSTDYVTLTLTSDEAGSVWCKAVLWHAIAPALPSGYIDHPADLNFTGPGTRSFNLTGLNANTDYDVYCYGVDVLLNANPAAEVYNHTYRSFKTKQSSDQFNRMGPGTAGLAPASVAGIVIGAIIGILLVILLAVGIKRWLNSRSDWTKNESLFLEAELAQKKKPAGDVAASSSPSSPVNNSGASPAPAPAAAAVSTSGKGNDGLPTL
jgi:tetrahydromethanopterin S-methyltransferase subunit F